MPKYTVVVDMIERHHVTIEADSLEHIQDLVYENPENYANMGTWHDSDIEIVDIWEAE